MILHADCFLSLSVILNVSEESPAYAREQEMFRFATNDEFIIPS